ncbi:hypothetical protein AB0D11_18790 [Streptomyces monashensis]|uniref:hypothetical protein n=1 Tax=Streptomyces monashensis TaxID=1678012 RepID=UPI0033FC3E1A
MNRPTEPRPSAADYPSSKAQESATPAARHQGNGRNRTSDSSSEKPSAWPAATRLSHEPSHPQGELAALEMLVAGMPQRHVKLHTRLSRSQVGSLAKIVTVETAEPAQPPNVIRDRHPRRPARIHAE